MAAPNDPGLIWGLRLNESRQALAIITLRLPLIGVVDIG